MQNEKLELCDMSPKFLDNIINTIGSPVFVKNEQSEFVFVNQPFCDFIGISQEDILGKMLSDSLPEDQMKYLLEVDAMVISSGQEPTYEGLFTRSDGKTLTVVTKRLVLSMTKETSFLWELYMILLNKNTINKLSVSLTKRLRCKFTLVLDNLISS